MMDMLDQKNFNLTILHGVNEEIITPARRSLSAARCSRHSKSTRIMIIDDMLINLQTFRGFLQNVYELSMLTSVGQALLQLKRQPEPDLVILDMDMPGDERH